MSSFPNRQLEIGKLGDSEAEIAALREHVAEVAEGQAFKGSDRCGKFLKYIVDEVIAGHPEALKERVIGVVVFGRSPAYDTSEDAIVRVTASDVRKRLLRHYGRNGSASIFRISLPVGSYVPEIVCEGQSSAGRPEGRKMRHFPDAETASFGATEPAPGLASISGPKPGPAPPGMSIAETVPAERRSDRRWLGFAALILIVNAALWGILWNRDWHPKARASEVQAIPASILPWSSILNSNRLTHLITSDSDIVKIQRFTGRRISVSDYANHNYIPAQNTLSPEIKKVFLTATQGDLTPLIDTRIVADVAALAKGSSKRVDVQGARSLQFSDLRSDDNFIFIGSPYSDPWFSVFNDQLDFRILAHNDKDLGPEFIGNVHPRPNEQQIYAPTAKGGATGETYGILALVGNPNQYGQVLLIAGISGEGTQAAGELATDLPSLSAALQKCGIPPGGPPVHFEILLRIKIMAGYPSQFDVAACHILRGPAR